MVVCRIYEYAPIFKYYLFHHTWQLRFAARNYKSYLFGIVELGYVPLHCSCAAEYSRPCFMHLQCFVAHSLWQLHLAISKRSHGARFLSNDIGKYVPFWMTQYHFTGFNAFPIHSCNGEWKHLRFDRCCTAAELLVEMEQSAQVKLISKAPKNTLGEWNFLLPVSYYQHNQHVYEYFLLLLLKRFFFIGHLGWGYKHWQPNLVASSLATESIFCAGTSPLSNKHYQVKP